MDGLEDVLVEQHGVVTHQQLRGAGVPAGQLRGGRWKKLRSGAYVPTSAYEAADTGRRLALAVAAERLVTGVDLVAVGPTAAVLHELPLLRQPIRLHLAERKDERPRHRGTSRVVPAEAVVEVDGVPVLDRASAAVDVARARDLAAGVVTCDGALAAGLARRELERALERCRRWPGVTRARAAVAFADGRAETALESLGRVRFHEQGLPPCELQAVLGDVDGPIGRVDHWWPDRRTVAEGDGAVKYATPAALFEEKRREDRLREAGFEVVRYTWDEVLRTPQLVAARVLAAFARASRRAA